MVSNVKLSPELAAVSAAAIVFNRREAKETVLECWNGLSAFVLNAVQKRRGLGRRPITRDPHD